MIFCCDPRSMVWNEEVKSPLNGWLKAYKDSHRPWRAFLSDLGLKAEIQKVQPVGDQSDSAQQAALRAPLWYNHKNTAFVAFLQ